MTPHTSPSRASYGVSFMRSSKKNYLNILRVSCTCWCVAGGLPIKDEPLSPTSSNFSDGSQDSFAQVSNQVLITRDQNKMANILQTTCYFHECKNLIKFHKDCSQGSPIDKWSLLYPCPTKLYWLIQVMAWCQLLGALLDRPLAEPIIIMIIEDIWHL